MHRDAVVESRRLKPEISALGAHGIPIRHELEFEVALPAQAASVIAEDAADAALGSGVDRCSTPGPQA